ncbi:MAG: cytochrome ubiquinol oxidase subunit I [Deferrisomatales bacterium]
MDLPLIQPPVFPRWVWIEEITYSHIPIATLITAYMVLAPAFEYVGYRRADPRYDRLARSLIWFSLILFSPGAALGTGIPMWLMGAYPEFWSRWANLFFWPLIWQFVFFLGEVVFLFFAYYLAWDRLKNRKLLHIAFGCTAAAFGLAVQVVWDSLGAYMLTPGAPLPGVNEPVGWSAAAFWNPSFPFLFSHRFFGNISWAMLLTGGVFALKHLRARDEGERAYFGWAGDLMFAVGFVAFFAMPLIGWGYARVIQGHAPIAFHAIMGGHVAPHFTIKMGFLAVLVLGGAGYLFARSRTAVLPALATAGLVLVLGVAYLHPPLDWLPGGKAAWRDLWVTGVLGLVVFLWALRGRLKPEAPFWAWAKLAVGLCAFSAFLIGGFVRERSKSPDTVYGEIVKPEVLPREADRYLLYERCLGCHPTPAVFEGYAARDWEHRVALERRRPEVRLTDDEAARLVRYLTGAYR